MVMVVLFITDVSSASSFTCLPYIRGDSDKIQRILNEVGVRVEMHPFLNIGKYTFPLPRTLLVIMRFLV